VVTGFENDREKISCYLVAISVSIGIHGMPLSSMMVRCMSTENLFASPIDVGPLGGASCYRPDGRQPSGANHYLI
jgi:hypothetical protein